jgi:TonB family protein
LASTLAGSQTSRPEILPGFKNKILILRGFYRDDNLHFRQDGQLVGPAESGFGPTDGTVHVAMVLLEPSKIVVIGDLPLLYYDAETEALHYSEGPIRRKIQIDLDDPQGAENALWKVFFRPGESPLPACSDAQRLDYQKRQLALLQSGEQPKGVPYPADGLCLPMGEKIVNRVGKDVTTPKSISTPDPIFPEDGPRGPFNGSVLLGMVIDSTGRPSTITILRGLGESLDHASVAKVLGWKFDPAMRDGKPVPVYVTAEIKFRRQ